MIKAFPNFSHLNISHKNEIRAVTGKFLPYSDFNFTSLFCWNTDDTAQIALLHDNLVICLPDYMTGEPVFSLLGNTKIDESLGNLFSITSTLAMVPQLVVDNIHKKSKYTIKPDRNNFDYVYQVSKLADLPGIDFKKKRNKIHGVDFELGQRLSILTSNTISTDQQQNLLHIFKHWAISSSKNDQEIASELAAFKRLLVHAKEFELILTELIVDDQIVGFSIHEIVDATFAICHFEKTIPVHANIYTLLAHQTAKTLKESGCTYVNWEQDLGLEGLRSSKLSYKPEYFLEKYTINQST